MRRTVGICGLVFSAVGAALGLAGYHGYAFAALVVSGAILLLSRRVWP